VQGDGRTEEEIRREIATEREQLAGALADLREGISAKRSLAILVLAGLGAVLALVVAFKVIRFSRARR
jgi:hypothetical protein